MTDTNRQTAPYVAITGMVGVGKTTLATRLAEQMDWELMSETVDQQENPWLERFYNADQEPNPYALPLQLYFLLDRIKQLRKHFRKGKPFIADQALEVDVGVFIRGHLQEGVLTQDEYNLLEQTYEQLQTHQEVRKPDLLVHLHAPLDTVLKQIRSRGRENEQDVNPEYWEQLYQRFEPPIPGCQNLPQITLDIRSYDAHDPKDVSEVQNIILQELPTQP